MPEQGLESLKILETSKIGILPTGRGRALVLQLLVCQTAITNTYLKAYGRAHVDAMLSTTI